MSLEEELFKIPVSDPEEELKYVDPDIAESCRKMGPYMIGTPSLMQLNRLLRELIKVERDKS